MNKWDILQGIVSVILGLFALYGIFYLLFNFYGNNSYNEGYKEDGYLTIYDNGTLINKTHIGHQEVLYYCRDNNSTNLSCHERFYGCGAVNCDCELKREKSNE
jgi:hypothetical protein